MNRVSDAAGCWPVESHECGGAVKPGKPAWERLKESIEQLILRILSGISDEIDVKGILKLESYAEWNDRREG